jgi:dipeptidyl aminopeptidase/acylaminoacyl peptidase
MSQPAVAPFGSWKSPITADLIVRSTIGLGQVALDGQDIYWIEQRPTEAGRSVVVRRSPDGVVQDVTPPDFNARTRVHEYGGGAYAVCDGCVYFSNYADQRVYRQDPGLMPRPITPNVDLRYADYALDRRRNRLICVREDHTDSEQEAENEIVALDWASGDGGGVLVSGHDFYSSPRVSPDGARLAWLAWNHPNMPWDGCELWVGEIAEDGTLGGAQCITGGVNESIFQPEWSPDGTLYFVSDRSGWWNLYRWRGGIEPLVPMAAEFGEAAWVFGESTYAFESAGRLVCAYRQDARWRLATLDTVSLTLAPVETPFTEIGDVVAGDGRVFCNAASPTAAPALVQIDLRTGQIEALRHSSDLAADPGYLSAAQPIGFPTEGGLTAYGYFYPPRNRDYVGPDNERPPLLVLSHGGPTSHAVSGLNLRIQYWTSRGFAVLDVDYGGSTGYGRAYRERLKGRWGIVDVDDCVNGTRYLAGRGEVDGRRLAIRGGSAGGYTTLAALTFRDAFATGASHYGVSDLEALVRDTHKFESRYLDGLVGPYPERRDIYLERSPIHFIQQLSQPLILLQGLEDKIVPPNQAEMMFEAVRAKGLPVAYLAFEGEQHGFRRAENIKRAMEAELYFYSKIFGFEAAGEIRPVQIENLDAWDPRRAD